MSLVSLSELFGFLLAVKQQFDSYSENNALVKEVVHRARLLLAVFNNHKEILLHRAMEATSRPLSASEASQISVEQEDGMLELSVESAYVMHVRHCEAALSDAVEFCEKFKRKGWIRKLVKFVLARTTKGSFAKMMLDLKSKQDEAQSLFDTEKEWQVASVSIRHHSSMGSPVLSSVPYVEENVTQIVSAAEEKFKAGFLAMVTDEAQSEILELVEMSSSERNELFGCVMENSSVKAAEVAQIFENIASDKAAGTFVGSSSDMVMQVKTRLKLCMNRLEAAIPSDRLLVDFEKSLGAGGYADVYAGTLLEGATWKTSVAVKILHIHPSEVQAFGREVAALRMISEHSNAHVMKFFGWSEVRMPNNSLRAALLVEHCKAPLHLALLDPHFAYIQDRVAVLRQIVQGMSFLVSKGLIHRDLKPENILFRYSNDPNRQFGDVVLSDFGLAVTTQTIHSMRTMQRSDAGKEGTKAYMAPELLAGKGPSELSDVFAFGVTAAFVLCLDHVFQSSSTVVVSDHSLRSFYALIVNDLGSESRQLEKIELLCLCCAENPSLRPRFQMLQEQLKDMVLSTGRNHSTPTVVAPLLSPPGSNSPFPPSPPQSLRTMSQITSTSTARNGSMSAAADTSNESIPLSSLSCDLAKLLLQHLKCRWVNDADDIDGESLQWIDTLEIIQDLENDKTPTRSITQKKILNNLQMYQKSGVPRSVVDALNTQSKNQQQELENALAQTKAELDQSKAEMGLQIKLLQEEMTTLQSQEMKKAQERLEQERKQHEESMQRLAEEQAAVVQQLRDALAAETQRLSFEQEKRKVAEEEVKQRSLLQEEMAATHSLEMKEAEKRLEQERKQHEESMQRVAEEQAATVQALTEMLVATEARQTELQCQLEAANASIADLETKVVTERQTHDDALQVLVTEKQSMQREMEFVQIQLQEMTQVLKEKEQQWQISSSAAKVSLDALTAQHLIETQSLGDQILQLQKDKQTLEQSKKALMDELTQLGEQLQANKQRLELDLANMTAAKIQLEQDLAEISQRLLEQRRKQAEEEEAKQREQRWLSLTQGLSETLRQTVEGVRNNDETFTTLYLGHNNISDLGAVALAEALQHNSTLTSLNLDNNSLTDAGAVAFAEALKHNSTLTALYLSNHIVPSIPPGGFFKKLHQLNHLSTLRLFRNNITDAGAVALAEALQHNSTLTTLSLIENNITDTVINSIEIALNRNKARKSN